MEHDFYDRDDGLQHCRVCNGGEGSLPSECPGRRMTDDEEERVYAGKLDYWGDAWVVLGPVPKAPEDPWGLLRR